MIVSAALVFANEADGFVGHAYFLVDPKTREAIESWLASVS